MADARSHKLQAEVSTAVAVLLTYRVDQATCIMCTGVHNRVGQSHMYYVYRHA